MSVTANDHRRFLQDKSNMTPPPAAPLLEQEESPEATTGDARLDKVIRAMESSAERAEENMAGIAHAVCHELNPEKRQQLHYQYMFMKGTVAAFREVQKLPARILVEEKSS